jgi:hypothetical protein
MASPTFGVPEPTSNGFVAVNERPSPPNGSAARPIELHSHTRNDSWQHTNGDSDAANQTNSPQSSLPVKRRFTDVDPSSDDGPSDSPVRNGVNVHLNGTVNGTANGTLNGNDNDSHYGQTQPGASRDASWNSHMDESHMAQLLQAAPTARPEDHQDARSQALVLTNGDAQLPAENIVVTKAGLSYDQKKRKRVSL